jgi:hypothetical protein
MTAAALPQKAQPYEVPEGGLASFLTATVGDWSDEALNSDNYYDIVKPTADQLAAFGREEDDRIAHVATGETVIPMAVFEEDPALKEVLFSRMRDMGIEPEQYIVGNQLNSINPVTGQPEFFLKKLFKGVKKAVKGVVKVFKKIAPMVLSIAGAALFGPIGAALGSGIGTLIQGGDLKDAFKSAAISGITAGVTQGIGQGFEAAGTAAKVAEEGGKALTFAEKLAEGVAGFGQSIGEGVGLVEGTSYLDQFSTASGILNPTGRETPAEIVRAEPVYNASDAVDAAKAPIDAVGAASKSPTNQLIEQKMAQRRLLEESALSGGATPVTADVPNATNQLIEQKVAQRRLLEESAASGGATPPSGGATPPPVEGITIAGVGDITPAVRQAADPGFFASMKKFFVDRDFGALKQAFLPGTKPEVIKAKLAGAGFNVTDAAVKEIAEALAPNMLRSYGPLAGLGIAGLAATGGFEQPEMGEMNDYGFGRPSNPYPFVQPGSLYEPIAAAKGGEIDHFPRKNGPINGPGTGTSDDIPAMLSDGEFVMTAKAVRGAGNGSRQAGMNRMYDMMRNFEGSAARGN